MKFQEQLNDFAERIEDLAPSIMTKEATKVAMVLPFIQILGYDIFNPKEFIPDHKAYVDTNKMVKVDYGITTNNGEPTFLIVCKPCYELVECFNPDLFNYFMDADVKFVVLTNGAIYKIYTALDGAEAIDAAPLLEFNLFDLNEKVILEIAKFAKENLDVDKIIGDATEMISIDLIKNWLNAEMKEPSPEMIKLIVDSTCPGSTNQKALNKFMPLVKKAFEQIMKESMRSDLTVDDLAELPNLKVEETPVVKSTTMDEFEAFVIVKSIIRGVCSLDKVFYRTNESYFGILYEDNNRKCICRVYLNAGIKYITIPDAEKKHIRYEITTVDDIYNYGEEMVESCRNYL